MRTTSVSWGFGLERAKGIESSRPAWKLGGVTWCLASGNAGPAYPLSITRETP
jgi:hypothetical protein